MVDNVHEIVNTIKNKEMEGDEELLSYLASQDINMLNRLLIIFKGQGGVTLSQAYNVSILGAGLIGIIIGFFVISPGILINYKAIFLEILTLGCVFGVIRIKKNTKQKAITIQSSKLITQQKIFTFIGFVLQDKYKEINRKNI